MRFVSWQFLLAIACFTAGDGSLRAAPLKDLGLEFSLGSKGAPMKLGAAEYRDAADRPISVTRADFLISGFALRRQDGPRLETDKWFA